MVLHLILHFHQIFLFGLKKEKKLAQIPKIIKKGNEKLFIIHYLIHECLIKAHRIWLLNISILMNIKRTKKKIYQQMHFLHFEQNNNRYFRWFDESSSAIFAQIHDNILYIRKLFFYNILYAMDIFSFFFNDCFLLLILCIYIHLPVRMNTLLHSHIAILFCSLMMPV